MAANAVSGAGFVILVFAPVVLPVREDMLDCAERVLAAVVWVLAGLTNAPGALVAVPGSKYSDGMSIQFVEFGKVPRVSSCSIASKVGTAIDVASSTPWVAT